MLFWALLGVISAEPRSSLQGLVSICSTSYDVDRFSHRSYQFGLTMLQYQT